MRTNRSLTRLTVAAACALALSACATGPSNKTDLCSSFDALGMQLGDGNGIFGNPLFHAVDDLSDVAARYPAGAVSAEAGQLHTIAKSDSTSIGDIMDATQNIGSVCGHELQPF